MPEPKMGLAALAQRAFTGTRERWRTQLTSATVLGQIRHEDEPVPAFNFDEARVASANDLVRLAELERTPRERRTDPGQLPDVAQTYADLAAGSLPGDPRRAELLALASSTWSLAGYQANSVALARQYQEAIDYAVGAAPLSAQVTTSAAPASIAAIVAAVLVRDVAEVARLGAASRAAVGELGQRMVAEAQGQPLDQADAAVLAAYGLTGRAAQRLSRFWLAGDQQAGEEAVATLRRASGILLQAGVVDTWSLVDNLGHVVEDLVATSPWRLLRRATSWNGRWTRYLRWLARDERPVVQVWPSQQEVLRSGLFDPSRPNLAVTMPTSAGKTNVAEWAILDALAASGADPFFRPLVVYVVPTRALAAQVERQLRGTLQRLGLTVSAVFGGWEHVEYELQLIDTTDALVATSEKLDLLLRNDPSLARRLALVVADEGHLLGEPVRGLRLELVLTHLRRIAPTARLLVLSAVLPNVDHIAEWIDPGLGDHNAIEVTWTPSRIRLGVFSWTGPNQDGQRGAVRYRPGDVDHGFFLPYVITRRKKLKNLYPSQPKDIAAELALHYERLGSVLVAAPTKPSARAVAGAVTKLSQKRGVDFGARGGAARPVEATELRQRAVDAVREYAGTGHELEAMVAVGVAYHHADVPEVIRHAIEDAFRGGAIRVLCATSTLGQGVNLPAKTVIVESTWRGQGDQIPVRDFWNVAGRAARPFQETDGHVILVAKTQSDVAKLNGRYLTTPTLEPVNSSLLRLYVALAKRRLPGLRRFEDVPEDLEFVDTDLNPICAVSPGRGESAGVGGGESLIPR